MNNIVKEGIFVFKVLAPRERVNNITKEFNFFKVLAPPPIYDSKSQQFKSQNPEVIVLKVGGEWLF